MDNLTHALIGIIAAETAIAWRSQKHKDISFRLRRYLWFASAAANNIPDVDFIYSNISGPELGYLLHHRGYTHTFLAAPILGLSIVTGKQIRKSTRLNSSHEIPSRMPSSA